MKNKKLYNFNQLFHYLNTQIFVLSIGKFNPVFILLNIIRSFCNCIVIRILIAIQKGCIYIYIYNTFFAMGSLRFLFDIYYIYTYRYK